MQSRIIGPLTYAFFVALCSSAAAQSTENSPKSEDPAGRKDQREPPSAATDEAQAEQASEPSNGGPPPTTAPDASSRPTTPVSEAPTPSTPPQPAERGSSAPETGRVPAASAADQGTSAQTKGTASATSPLRDPADIAASSHARRPKTAIFAPGEVTVSAEKVATIDRAATQTVVTAKDIEAHDDRNLADTLQLVPGMSTYQHGKGHIRFRLRGFEMPYVALLVDGIPIADVYEANIDISKLPVLNASAIVINRGTSSALYGTNGTIGSINIITTKPLSLYARAQGEVGFNGDYLANVAHGNALGNYYYWVTGTVEKQAPFEISGRLHASSWLRRSMPSGLGYTIDASNSAANEYLNAREWPHQDMLKYVLSAKLGYQHPKGLETGVAFNFAQSNARRFSITPTITEEFTQGGWPTNDPTLRLGAGAFHWRDVYSFSLAPYAQYRADRFSIKGNVYYQFTSELLDGYQDSTESIPIAGWGGVHSNWRNTSEGFNVFPSYVVSEWNRINGSVLFRWDKHVERIQADDAFVGRAAAGGGADAAYALAGDEWALAKVMSGDQVTLALEDEISLTKLARVPLELSLGASYDAQKLDRYRARSQTMAQGRVTEFGRTLEDQYLAKSESTLWGTRDSLNPVIGLTYRPLEDRLLLRASLSRKAKLPTMAQYANVYENTDLGLKPERSINANFGLQLYLIKRLASLRADYFLSRFRDKLATIYDPATPSVRYYTNVAGQNHQGVEILLNAKAKHVLQLGDIDSSISYTYVRVRNVDTDVDNSLIAKGPRVADVPEHQVAADFQLTFATKTALMLFGSYTANAIRYTMQDNPAAGTPFSPSHYRQLRLHDPVMLNAKLSQNLGDHLDLYFMIRNLLDDYAADPFNPGPGRQFYLGARVTY